MIQNFTAGDSVEFTETYPEYLSDDGWTAILYFSGPSSLQIAGIATNGAFTFTMPSSQTSYLKAGLYSYSIRVTKVLQNVTVYTNNVSVYQNPAIVTNKEAVASRMIDLIEKALLNQLSAGEAVESISVAGRSLTLMNRTELLSERGFWNRELKALRNARTGNSGIRQISIII